MARDLRRRRLLLSLLVVTAALGGCGGGDDPQRTAAARPVRYAYARGLFRDMCAGCHRLTDAGASGPVNLDDIPEDYARRKSIVDGTMRVGGEHMPGWSETFSDTEMEALIQYVVNVAGHAKRSGDGKRATILTPIDNGTEPPKDRIAYGRALFKQICAGCHTLADAGAHGKRYDLDYNYAGISERERRMRAHAGLRGGPPFMPNWERSLLREQVEVLTDYVFEVTGRRSS